MTFIEILQANVPILFAVTLISLILNLILSLKIATLNAEIARLRGGALTREELEVLKARLTRLKKLTR
ncbi:MAG: hypothetical protein J7L10_01050 [Methanomicrobia archaeon]|nr:hypothetical protein [Methanomicrobia archaeon]RLF95920.1 MAG: hypothetical protein DRN50_02945 [Thermococci archaeon]RLF98102.1 MAG: hypothetical protein DRN58_07585 [Thermococci archaeon]HDN81345.1 hypothetical protein [Methanomicrobia archaeon]